MSVGFTRGYLKISVETEKVLVIYIHLLHPVGSRLQKTPVRLLA
jgi:hypothetical protein